MADTKEIATRTLLIAGGLFVVAVVALGVFYLVGPRDQIVAQEERDEVEEPRQGYEEGLFSGEVTAGERGEVLDSLENTIVLLDYDYDRQADEIAGSILNNSRQPYVNVQVGFRLLNARDEVVGTVADTIGQVGPGASERFNIALPMDQPISSILPVVLTAQLREVVGQQADPQYQQNDYPYPRNQPGVPDTFQQDTFEPDEDG